MPAYEEIEQGWEQYHPSLCKSQKVQLREKVVQQKCEWTRKGNRSANDSASKLQTSATLKGTRIADQILDQFES